MNVRPVVGTTLFVGALCAVPAYRYIKKKHCEYVCMGREMKGFVLNEIDPKVQIIRTWSAREFEEIHGRYKDSFLEQYDQCKTETTTHGSKLRQWFNAIGSSNCNCNCESSQNLDQLLAGAGESKNQNSQES